MFTPGKIVKEFTTKSGATGVIRYPMWEDVPKAKDFINKLSKEDTYITFSGEEISLKDEADYYGSIFSMMELGDCVKLHCMIDNEVVSSTEVTRDRGLKKRSLHVGTFGISVAEKYRHEGVGYEIMTSLMSEVKHMMPDLRLITLSCFGQNTVAQNLYKKVGFVECGRIPGKILHQGQYDDEMIMCYTLQ